MLVLILKKKKRDNCNVSEHNVDNNKKKIVAISTTRYKLYFWNEIFF